MFKPKYYAVAIAANRYTVFTKRGTDGVLYQPNGYLKHDGRMWTFSFNNTVVMHANLRSTILDTHCIEIVHRKFLPKLEPKSRQPKD